MVRMVRLPLMMLMMCLMAASAASATTYYIAANGSDSNNGTSKSSPWLHALGMNGCAGVCASTTPKAGDQFILRGGDTWMVSGTSTWWTVTWSGSASNMVEIGGLDQSWFVGSSWSRPILNGGGTFPGNTFPIAFLDVSGGHYIDVADIEFTGMYWNDASQWFGYVITAANTHNSIHDNYIHGWSHAASGRDQAMAILCGTSNGTSGTSLYNNIIDGSDTARDSLTGVYGGGCYPIYQNYISYVQSGLNGSFPDVHDNTFYQTCRVPYSTAHNNGLQQYPSPLHSVIYNNVFDTFAGDTGYCVGLNPEPQSGDTVYAFNNVTANGSLSYNQACSADANGGNCLFLHNTFECGPDSSPTVGCTTNAGGTSSQLVNNHWITNTAPGCNGSCTWTPNPNVAQTKSAANAQGYSYSQRYIFSPPSSSGATVGASSNDSSYCTTIGSYNSTAGTACMFDTTYGVAYDSTFHTVSFPARTPTPRPTSGPWDAGAYQFAGTGTLNPPSGLTAVVN